MCIYVPFLPTENILAKPQTWFFPHHSQTAIYDFTFKIQVTFVIKAFAFIFKC